MPTNITQLKREALAARVTGWSGAPVLDPPKGWATRVLADIREADEDEAREEQRRMLEAHTIRCRVCGAPTASGYACAHGGRL